MEDIENYITTNNIDLMEYTVAGLGVGNSMFVASILRNKYCTIPGASFESVFFCHYKPYLKAHLNKDPFWHLFIRLDSTEEDLAVQLKNVRFPCFVKGVYTCASNFGRKTENMEELIEYLDLLRKINVPIQYDTASKDFQQLLPQHSTLRSGEMYHVMVCSLISGTEYWYEGCVDVEGSIHIMGGSVGVTTEIHGKPL